MDATFKIGLLLTAATGGAVSAITNVIKSTDSLKESFTKLKQKIAIGADIEKLSGKLKVLQDKGEGSSAAAKKLEDRLSKLREQARGAGIDVARLGQEMARLRVMEQGYTISLTGRQLSERGRDLRSEASGNIMGTLAGAAALAAPVVPAAKFSDQVQDIAITGNLDRKGEIALGKEIRRLAQQTNQTQEALAQGVAIMVANGMKPEQAQKYAGLLGDTATATRASMDDLAQLMFGLKNQLKIETEADMKAAMDALAHAGKQGQFELRHMARYFPELGAQMASFGATGLNAVKELGMAMQVARKYSGTNEEAARNAANWFSHMTASHTVEQFEKLGIDYRGEVLKRVQRGQSSLLASLDVVDGYIDKVAGGQKIEVKDKKGRVKETLDFRQALEASAKSGNEQETMALVSRFGLSKVLQDMQTVNFYLAMRQGRGMFQEGMASYETDEARGVVERDKGRRLESPVERMKKLKIAMTEIGISLGKAVLPALVDIGEALAPVLGGVADFAKAHPGLVRFGAVLGAMVVSFSVVGMAAKWLFGGLLSFIGPLVRLVGWFARLEAIAPLVARAGAWFSGLWGTIARGAAMAGGVLMGRLAAGVRIAGQAVLWLGRALLMNPIGLIATAVAFAGYLIWRNWDRIGPMFQKVVSQAKAALSALWGWVKDLAGRFFQAGADLVQGLWRGIESLASKPVEAIKKIGADVAGAFKGLLGIRSPSRVFMGFGDNIGQGAAIGIESSLPRVQKAVGGLAGTALGVARTGPVSVGPVRIPSAAGGQGAAAGAVTVHFSPVIQVSGSGDVGGQVKTALADGYREFEANMRRFMAEQQRRAF